MKQQSAFVIKRFKNQSGLLSWRIDGRLHDLRIRKNSKSREEAAAEKAALDLKSLQVSAGMQSATTFLEDAQLREAENRNEAEHDVWHPFIANVERGKPLLMAGCG